MEHPAKYSKTLLPCLARSLRHCRTILDPFGGVGTIGQIKEYGIKGKITTVEIEPEWATQAIGKVDTVIVGDALNLPLPDGSFDAVCTSPTYGNRMADHCNWQDGSKRHTYKAYLGRALNENNSGQLQWGDQYRKFHTRAWAEVWRVLKPHGRFVLNVSDHVRNGTVADVSQWHVEYLRSIGFFLTDWTRIETQRNRHGSNNVIRVGHENVFLFIKGS